MPYITSDLVTKVQKRIRDTSYPAVDIKEHLTHTIYDVYNEYELRFMKTSVNYTVAIGNSDITAGVGLPTNYVNAIKLLDTTSGQEKEITYMDEEDLDALYADKGDTVLHQNGQPQYWYDDGTTLRLFPAPAGAYTLKLRYRKKPTELTTDAQVPELPSEFEELLLSGASYRALQVKDNYDQAGIHENKCMEEKQKLVARYSRIQTGQVQRMRPSRRIVQQPSSTRWR